MNRLPWVAAALSFLLLCGITALPQNSNSTTAAKKPATAKPKRGPIFRATSDQIVQAQALLKQRNLYSGEEVKKLTPEVRASLKEYQKAEGLKVTGTLNKETLMKMGIPLTDKQKAM
jgi:peptidoglycan hydrolase-like protein with peptidoglycan-binding domain